MKAVLSFPSYTCVKLVHLNRLPPNQLTIGEQMQKQRGELHGFLLRQRLTEDLQRLTKMEQCHSCPHFFCFRKYSYFY